MEADHLCFKCGSKESFEQIRTILETESLYVYQSIISKRRIAYVRLKTPIETFLGPIKYIELSDQKPDLSQKEGFDHIEAFPLEESYEAIADEVAKSETVSEFKRAHHHGYDIDISEGFLFRITQGPLIDKIRIAEMK